MAELFHGTVAPDLEVRSSGDGRTIFGIAVPWDTPQKINDNLTEQFNPAFSDDQIRENNPLDVWFAREHVKLGGSLIGTTQVMRRDGAGLYVELRTSKTPLGEETLELVRDGALREMSVMFRPDLNRRLPGGIVERVRGRIKEVAIVLQGAYGKTAMAAGVRAAGAVDTASEPETFVTPDRAQLDRILAEMAARRESW